jgi:hypothetical protein
MRHPSELDSDSEYGTEEASSSALDAAFERHHHAIREAVAANAMDRSRASSATTPASSRHLYRPRASPPRPRLLPHPPPPTLNRLAARTPTTSSTSCPSKAAWPPHWCLHSPRPQRQLRRRLLAAASQSSLNPVLDDEARHQWWCRTGARHQPRPEAINHDRDGHDSVLCWRA